MNQDSRAIIYQAENGTIELKGDVANETVWTSQKEISDIFKKDRTVITRYINNILRDKEIDEKSNVHFLHIANSVIRKFRIVQKEGPKEVYRNVVIR